MIGPHGGILNLPETNIAFLTLSKQNWIRRFGTFYKSRARRHPQRPILHSKIRGRSHSNLLPQSSVLGGQSRSSGCPLARDCANDLESCASIRFASLPAPAVHCRRWCHAQEYCSLLASHHRLQTYQHLFSALASQIYYLGRSVLVAHAQLLLLGHRSDRCLSLRGTWRMRAAVYRKLSGFRYTA